MREIVFIDIDTQVDFMSPSERLYVPGAEELLPNLKLLTQIAGENDILIVSSLDSHAEGDPEFKRFPPHCVIGSRGQEKVPQTRLKKGIVISSRVLDRKALLAKVTGYPQLILEKNTYDVFTNFNLSRLLRPFSEAYVYGVALDYCVKYAVLGLLQCGLKVNLVTDAVKPVDFGEGKRLLAVFKQNGVRLVNTKQAVSRIRSLKGEK